MTMVTKQWIVEGRVQGVSFRAQACRKALELGLKGWVRNLADGNVESLAQGDETQLRLYHSWLLRGPVGASVKCVTEVPVAVAANSGEDTATPQNSSDEFKDFVIRR